MYKILILDGVTGSRLGKILREEGYTVSVAQTAGEVIGALRSEKFHLLMAHLPDQEFNALYKILDLKSSLKLSLPVLILAPTPTVPKIILTLERGANDIMESPYHKKILISKVRALIRSASRLSDSKLTVNGDIVIDPKRHEVRVTQTVIRLTAAQFKLLSLFVENPGKIFSREELLGAVSQGMEHQSRSVDTQIVVLRKRLGKEGRRIKTKRGIGYVFV